MSKEGGLKAPKREPIPWDDPMFYDEKDFDQELKRVSDVCHSCRRCFNLCASFPKLFDAIDASKTGEVDDLSKKELGSVVDACTLCDMCFMVKCPYVPPHPFNIDFPHLMLRGKAIAARKKGVPWAKNQLTKTDRNGALGTKVPVLANWALKTKNRLGRIALEKVTGVHKEADLPSFQKGKFQKTHVQPALNKSAPGFGKKVVFYHTCLVSYQEHSLGAAVLAFLAHQGVEAIPFYTQCCAMPRFEQGLLAEAAENAVSLSDKLWPFVEAGHKIISPVPSCTLMMAKEWPLLHPNNKRVCTVADAVMDAGAYYTWLLESKGLAPPISFDHPARQTTNHHVPHNEEKSEPPARKILLHRACHSRALNQGDKAKQLLSLLPNTDIQVAERCSGHGGSWGIFKENFTDGLKVGKPVMKQIARKISEKNNVVPPEDDAFGQHKEKSKMTTLPESAPSKTPAPDLVVASECPLACRHLKQGTNILLQEESNKKESFLAQTADQKVLVQKNPQGVSLQTSQNQEASKIPHDSSEKAIFEHPLQTLARAWGVWDTSSRDD